MRSQARPEHPCASHASAHHGASPPPLLPTGALKRDPNIHDPEDVLLLRSIRDMNAPKFIVQDMPLFNALMSDLFPGAEPPIVCLLYTSPSPRD